MTLLALSDYRSIDIATCTPPLSMTHEVEVRKNSLMQFHYNWNASLRSDRDIQVGGTCPGWLTTLHY